MTDRKRSIQEEAYRRHPVDHELDDPHGETGVAPSDPYGYEETARQAFIEGAEFALKMTLPSEPEMARVVYIADRRGVPTARADWDEGSIPANRIENYFCIAKALLTLMQDHRDTP